jgi:hypothetical protein
MVLTRTKKPLLLLAPEFNPDNYAVLKSSAIGSTTPAPKPSHVRIILDEPTA